MVMLSRLIVVTLATSVGVLEVVFWDSMFLVLMHLLCGLSTAHAFKFLELWVGHGSFVLSIGILFNSRVSSLERDMVSGSFDTHSADHFYNKQGGESSCMSYLMLDRDKYLRAGV
ncbi:hypothetical protein BC943DRAFT_331958 [Umbelopsis sp. AD052]|nr:hypothetical protein BC943DRAFT_331958 [Umbelopsis sp. AD052]